MTPSLSRLYLGSVSTGSLDGVFNTGTFLRTQETCSPSFFFTTFVGSLQSIVYAFLSGQSAEAIAQAFPVLSLEQVYGAITYYLARREELDRYLEARQQEFEVKGRAARDADPMFYQKLVDAKKQTPLIR